MRADKRLLVGAADRGRQRGCGGPSRHRLRFDGAVARLAAAGLAEATADPIRDIPRLEGTDKHAA
jgi:hypothetical protein